MTFSYTPQGVCSRRMEIEVDDKRETILNLKVIGGCPGNLLGISSLVKNRPVDEVIALLAGTRCGNKSTSCPDQLAKALTLIKQGGNQQLN